MRCPRCSFEGDLVDGACPRCGYWRLNISGDSFSGGSVSRRYTLSSTPVSASASRPLTIQRVKRGDVLRQGRYRLIEQLMLPENQRGQGTAWLASDAQSSTRRVVIREVTLPGGSPADRERVVRLIASRMAE